MIFTCFNDVENWVKDQPLDSPHLYFSDYALLVALDYVHLDAFYELDYGTEWPELDEKEFWDLFKAYEIPSDTDAGEFIIGNKIEIDHDTYNEVNELVIKEGTIVLGFWEHVGFPYLSADYLRQTFLESHVTFSTNTWSDFAQEVVQDTMDVRELPDIIRYNIDWDGVISDLQDDFFEVDHHIFRNV